MQKIVKARTSHIKDKEKLRKKGEVTGFQNSETVISCDSMKEKHWCESETKEKERNIAPITID